MKRSLQTTSTEILRGGITVTLFKLSLPTITAFAFHTLFNFIDRLFISYVGEVEFAAIGMAFILQMVLIAIGVGLSIGTTSLVARFIGAGKRTDANRTASHALVLAACVYIPLGFLGPLFSEKFFLLIGTSAEMLPHVTGYADIILLGSAFQLFMMTGNGILRGEGNTIAPMRAMMTATLCNIILDPLLIFGPGFLPALGVKGAALATVASRAVGCIILARSLFGRGNLVRPSFRRFRFSRKYMKGIWGVGGPTTLATGANSIGLSIIFLLLRAYGDPAKAAFTMGFTYQQLALLPVIGLSSGILTMVGQNYGAGNMDRIRYVLTRGASFAVVGMAILTITYSLARYPLARVFVDGEEALAAGVLLLPILSLGFPFMATRAIVASAFQGLGMGMRSLTLSMLQMVFLSLPLAWLGDTLIGFPGIWVGLVSGHALSSMIGIAWIVHTWKTLSR